MHKLKKKQKKFKSSKYLSLLQYKNVCLSLYCITKVAGTVRSYLLKLQVHF
jgi:hypothetical protein